MSLLSPKISTNLSREDLLQAYQFRYSGYISRRHVWYLEMKDIDGFYQWVRLIYMSGQRTYVTSSLFRGSDYRPQIFKDTLSAILFLKDYLHKFDKLSLIHYDTCEPIANWF